jgi:hypothetical protein
MRKKEWTLGKWMYERMYCTKKYRNKQKEWLMPPNLLKEIFNLLIPRPP